MQTPTDTDIQRASDVRDDVLLGMGVVTDTREDAENAVENMDVHQLFDWVDDLDLVLASMPVATRQSFMDAYRKVVADAMVSS